MPAPTDFVPDGAKPADFTPDPSRSIFDTPGQKLKRLGKSAAEFAAGAAPSVAASALGPAGVAGQIGAQAVAGAVAPLAEYGVSKLFHEQTQAPTVKDALKSAAFTAGIAAVGAGISGKAGKAESVAGDIRGLPAEAQTGANVKQALGNREFWKGLGVTDEQLDELGKSPDAQAAVMRNLAAGKSYRQAFQTVLDDQRASFNTRYTTILGPHAEVTVDAAPIGSNFEAAAQGTGQHELTPTFRAFLQRKGLELSKAGESGGPSVGGVPWKQLPEQLKAQIRAQGGAQGIKAPTSDLSIAELRNLRTELRENLPASATNLDKKTFQQLTQDITDAEQHALKTNGATVEQLGALKALDEEYGTFQQTIKQLDPRSERFGSDLAKVLWSNAARNPADAENFIRMAETAELARPGEVMEPLRASFVREALQSARSAAQGRPLEEMRLIQTLQKQWGGDQQLRTVASSLFGKNSPLANPTTLARTLGVLGNADKAAADASKGILAQLGQYAKSPGFLARLAIGYGTYRMIAGGTGSPWKDLGDPSKMIPPLVAMMMGGKVADYALGAADARLQRAYVNFLLEPSPKSLLAATTALSGATAGLTGMPTPQEVAESR